METVGLLEIHKNKRGRYVYTASLCRGGKAFYTSKVKNVVNANTLDNAKKEGTAHLRAIATSRNLKIYGLHIKTW